MAGRIVVLQFDTKKDYEWFLAESGRDNQAQGWGTVIGQYLLPDRFCKCKREKAEAKNSKLHSKYKIWVCRHCGRPSQYWNKGIPIRLRMALGWNLDDPEPIA